MTPARKRKKNMKLKIIGLKDAQYIGNAAAVLGGWVAVGLGDAAVRTADLVGSIGWSMEMAAQGEHAQGNRHDGPYLLAALPESWTEGREVSPANVERIVACLRGEIARDESRTYLLRTREADLSSERQWLAAIVAVTAGVTA